jgi:hypothetical protein
VVSTEAYQKERLGRSRERATCRKSGGMGKMKESRKAKTARAQVPAGWWAQERIQA